MDGSTRRPRTGLETRFREHGKRAMRRAFELAQRAGIDVLPHHFYSNVPDVRALAAWTEWKKPRSMMGVAGTDVDKQLAALATWLSVGVPKLTWEAACREHGEPGYGPIESDVLYAFIRSHKPPRIVQVGAGVSTAIVLRAADDAGYHPEVVCVDPFPTSYLATCATRGAITLIQRPAQEVEERVLRVDDGDLLFIDSTHTVKPGSEVNRLIFDVLPQLPRGAWVHFHDVTFPFDYGRGLMTDDVFFWTESTLLLAFLVGNARYSLAVALSMLHYARPRELQSLLSHYRPQPNDHGLRLSDSGHFPSSAYLRVVA